MAGTFIIGEKKVRPGAYFNVTKKNEGITPAIISGVVGVAFKSDFGPLGTVKELSTSEGYEKTFGTGGTTDAIREAFNGGAITVLAVRIGNGGTAATIKLKSAPTETVESKEIIQISGNYPGSKPFSVTIKEKLTDSTVKQCIIYSGSTEFEKIEFDAGTDEARNLVNAFQQSENFTAQLLAGETGASVVKEVSQEAFTAGTDPQTTTSDYSDAFAQLESYEMNTLCVDTNDTAVHLLLFSFVTRVYEAGQFVIGVIGEPSTVPFATRMQNALAYNDYRMVYVLNGHVTTNAEELDGYQTAARIAGMVAAVPANKSLTHTVLSGVAKLNERLTNSNIVKAEQSGCLVLSVNADKQIWIDSAINTLVTPDEEHDAGWKKIRRTKTRFELMYRVNTIADSLVGKVDNDTNGRKTILSQLLSVGQAMIAEGKLVQMECYEDENYVSDGDEAYFKIDVVDKDSAEHIYLQYQFQFSSLVAE